MTTSEAFLLRASTRCVAIFALIVAGGAFFAKQGRTEADGHGFDYGEIDQLFTDPLDKDGYIDFGPLDPPIQAYFQWKDDLGARTGFNYLIEDRLINQWGDGASIYDNEINTIARWDVLDSETFGETSFNVWGQFAQSLGDTGGEFQADWSAFAAERRQWRTRKVQ